MEEKSPDAETQQPWFEGTPTADQSTPKTIFVSGDPLIGPKSSAAVIIGWILIILGAFGVLSIPLTLFDFGAADMNGNPITTSVTYKIVTVLFGLASSGLSIFGGYKMTKYEKQGVWLVFASFGISWIGSIVSPLLLGDSMGIGDSGGAALAGLSGFCGIFFYAICGLIVAIPLLMSNGGME
jgi:hypothetical protein